MSRHSFLAALLGALLSTAAFAQGGYTIVVPQGAPGWFVVSPLASSHNTIQAAIEAIRADACDNDIPVVTSVSIQFGTGGTNVLDIGTATARFGNLGTNVNWCNFVLEGKITSSACPDTGGTPSGTVTIVDGVYVTSNADIINTCAILADAGSPAILIKGGGSMRINGGTVANPNKGQNGASVQIGASVNYGGKVILSGSPIMPGYIKFSRGSAGALSVITEGSDRFAPAEQYKLWVDDGAIDAGDVAVVGGANFISSFTLANSNFILAVSGNDLVFAVPNSSSSSLTPSSSSDGGSSSSSETVPIAHSPLPAIHSEATAYYNMKGEPMGSSKPATPGVYLVKQGSSIRKVVVR